MGWVYSDLTSFGNQDIEIPTMFINSSSSCPTCGHAEEIRFFSKKMIVQSHQQKRGGHSMVFLRGEKDLCQSVKFLSLYLTYHRTVTGNIVFGSRKDKYCGPCRTNHCSHEHGDGPLPRERANQSYDHTLFRGVLLKWHTLLLHGFWVFIIAIFHL